MSDKPIFANVPITERMRSPLAWAARDLDDTAWLHTLDAACIAEIQAFVEHLRRHPLPTIALSVDDFDFASCRTTMARVRDRLINGCGFAQVDRLPMAALTKEEAKAVYWLLSTMICRPVAQNLVGALLYDVHDTGKKALPGSGVRPDKTNIDLTFHNDNSYNDPLPDFVGLICLQPAKRGGLSRVMSFETAHNAVLERHPASLERLYRPFHFDRQREHFPDEPPTISAPVFENNGGLSARLGIHQVRSGYAVLGEAMDGDTSRAVSALEDVFSDHALQFQFMMEAGQIQYVNNKVIGHSRTEFEDFEEPDARRHLVRIWMRDNGDRSYPG